MSLWKNATFYLTTLFGIVEIYATIAPVYGLPFDRRSPYYLALVVLVVLSLIYSAYKRYKKMG